MKVRIVSGDEPNLELRLREFDGYVQIQGRKADAIQNWFVIGNITDDGEIRLHAMGLRQLGLKEGTQL